MHLRNAIIGNPGLDAPVRYRISFGVRTHIVIVELNFLLLSSCFFVFIRYYSERGDAVAKASKQPHVGDYRQLVHELDQYQYSELRLVVLDLRNTYAALFDIVNKNYDKIKKPRGDGKAPIY
uniref:Proteasome activator subunit 1 n=1 Tax=Sphaeramia orbicularis TaxID=375764 RepID=A0A673CG33_9TELE